MKFRDYKPSSYAMAIFLGLVVVLLWFTFCQDNLLGRR